MTSVALKGLAKKTTRQILLLIHTAVGVLLDRESGTKKEKKKTAKKEKKKTFYPRTKAGNKAYNKEKKTFNAMMDGLYGKKPTGDKKKSKAQSIKTWKGNHLRGVVSNGRRK